MRARPCWLRATPDSHSLQANSARRFVALEFVAATANVALPAPGRAVRASRTGLPSGPDDWEKVAEARSDGRLRECFPE